MLSPLSLVQCRALRDRGIESIAESLRTFVATAASRGFQVLEVRCDGEGAVGALRDELMLMGLRVELAGPGQHVPVVERMIETVKQRVRAHEHSLPYLMPKLMIVWCVLFSVRSVNLQPSRTSTDRTSPHEQFTGMKLDARRDLRIAFGDYVQATVPVTDNTMSARTLACIALLPVGNLTGSVRMWCIQSDRVITRDQFTILPMPDLLIAAINKRAEKEGYARGSEPNFKSVAEQGTDGEEPGPPQEATMMPIDGRADAVPPTEDAGAPAGVIGAVSAADDALEGEPGDAHPPRRSARLAGQAPSWYVPPGDVLMIEPFRSELQRQLLMRTHWHDGEFAFHISVRAAIRERGDEARPVIIKELQQMVQKGVWHGVRVTDLSDAQRRSIIRSSMFLKDKYLASGAFEKFKARLVAGGDQQDKSIYENLSSPTASTTSVMTVAAIAAAEHRHVTVVDIGGAFLNADMKPTGVLVHMRLDRIMTAMLLEIVPAYSAFVEPSGTMVVQLDKALYGCVEAAALWYHNLRSKLIAFGFVENPYDLCVFNKSESGVQITIALHVDDLLITSSSPLHIDKLDAYLKKVYPETKTTAGRVVDYLGMSFDFSVRGEVRITMKNCVDDIIQSGGDAKERVTPATEALSDAQRRSIIRSSMFLKDKYLASGAFEKFKARLVAGGDQQDKSIYENLSSPTASTTSVMTVAAIAAAEHRHVTVVDIGGAFLNADMKPTGVLVHMRLDRIMTAMLLEIVPAYSAFVEPSWTMVVQLDKALYGCRRSTQAATRAGVCARHSGARDRATTRSHNEGERLH